VTPDRTPELVVPRVTFEVERFEWTAADRLELVGRWFGLRGHRFLRPTLDVEVEGERRRMLADLEHKPWAPEEGQEWVAAFTWRGDPATFEEAELTVSPDLAVQLPAPEGASKGTTAEAAGPAADRLPARRPRMAVLEGELAAALAEVERLKEELDRVRETHSEAGRELRERAAGEQEKARRLEAELEKASGRIVAAEAAAAEAIEEARRARDAAEAARDEAVSARDAALAKRDEALAAREAAQKEAAAAAQREEGLAEARDRARQERNAWMSRARAATTSRPLPSPEPSPPPPSTPPTEKPKEEERTEPSGRRTIQIGERPGPMRPEPPSPVPNGSPRLLDTWGPRLLAVLVLAVIVVVVVLLLAWAL
jgi:hypothetical protein